ncbi:hypothetical protein Ddc_17907 [Ditylenchus destructor]|nr:hypothetical protein Ddc_17907 [Ditylenchus destructor]
MAGQLYDELYADLPGVQTSASAESLESEITSKTTDTANSSESDPAEEQFKTRSLKSYTMAFKLEVIDFAIKKNINHAASNFYKVWLGSKLDERSTHRQLSPKSEDDKIVCFRQAIPIGRETLRSARQKPDIEMVFAEEEDIDENIINGLDDMEIV